jgi:hypothetical protein
VLWEIADVVEQIFRIACTENLYPRAEEFDAAACDYQAAHGLSYSKMCEQMRQYGTLSEIHERAQVIALMRFYRARWRVWDPEGRRVRLPSRQSRPASRKRLRKCTTTSKGEKALLTGGVSSGVKSGLSVETSTIIST